MFKQSYLTSKYATFLKVPEHEPHYQIQFSVITGHSFGMGVLPYCRDAVGLFYDTFAQPTGLCM